MSTHLKAPNDQSPRPDDADGTAEEKKKVLDLSLTQIVGGALAAMTAAALGSTLGVGGTIAGAAFASVIAGVAGSLYTASLRTGREKVRTVFRGQSPDAASAPPGSVAQATAPSIPAAEETLVAPVWDPLPLEKPTKDTKSEGRFPWKRAVAISLAVFALAAVLITGYERVSGQTLSGGSGTTVSQVRDDRGTAGDEDSEPTPSPSSSASSGSTPTASETPAPSASESSSASPAETQSPTPNATESTAQSTPEPSAADDGTAPATQ
jgi:hypothetical protein